MLNDMLQEGMPSDEVTVDTEPWRILTPDRLNQLVDLIQERKPQYLVMQPVHFWVVTPILRIVGTGSPTGLWRVLDAARPLNRRLENWLLDEEGSTALACAHQWLLSFLEQKILRAHPMFTVPEAIAATEWLVRAALKLESTQVIILGEARLERDGRFVGKSAKAQSVARRSRPAHTAHLAWEFDAGLREMAKRGLTTYVEGAHSNPEDRAGDRRHTGPERARLRAAQLCEAILQLESNVKQGSLALRP
jgi:hypothetical protein